MYYKAVKDGYIVALGIGQCAVEIGEEEHAEILKAIVSKPEATDGYGYHLKEDLTWELYELPPEEETDEATEADYLEALAEMGVDV